MNAGLSNLDTLKKHLLSPNQKGDTTFDPMILAIGLGMAGLIDTFCNRVMAYWENERITFSGDRPHYYLTRFPIVSISAVEMRYFISDDRSNITGEPLAWNQETGLLHFGYTLGRNPLQVRVTWIGGFWYQTLEPDDANYLVCDSPTDPGFPAALPAAIQALDPVDQKKSLLPASIKSAWLLQCQQVWSMRDKLGLSMIDKPGEQANLSDLALIPLAKMMLQPYIRYQLY
jgi:hypothetical protein